MSTQNQGELVPEWTVGDRLRKAREILGLEQEAFAQLILSTRGTVSNYERGTTRHYKPMVLRAWATATNVSVEWLETGEGSSAPSPTDPARTDDKLARLTEQKRSRARGKPDTRQYFPAFALLPDAA